MRISHRRVKHILLDRAITRLKRRGQIIKLLASYYIPLPLHTELSSNQTVRCSRHTECGVRSRQA